MPAIDDPFSIAASLPGQMAELKRQVKDLSVNNTQAISQALAVATASAASASAAATALQASVVTPVTTVTTSTATAIPFSLTATMVVPAGATRCFYTCTAGVYGQSTGSFQVKFNVNAPSTGSTGYLAAGAAPFGGAGTSSATGSLTGLTPGSTLSFTASIGTTFSGTISLLESRVQSLAVFQP